MQWSNSAPGASLQDVYTEHTQNDTDSHNSPQVILLPCQPCAQPHIYSFISSLFDMLPPTNQPACAPYNVAGTSGEQGCCIINLMTIWLVLKECAGEPSVLGDFFSPGSKFEKYVLILCPDEDITRQQDKTFTMVSYTPDPHTTLSSKDQGISTLYTLYVHIEKTVQMRGKGDSQFLGEAVNQC